MFFLLSVCSGSTNSPSFDTKEIQSPLVIVDLLIVDSLVIVDRLSRPNVYFSMYFSRNSGFSRYSGQFAADGRIHYYERRLYLIPKLLNVHKTHHAGKGMTVLLQYKILI